MVDGIAPAAPAGAGPATLSPFLHRLRAQAVGQLVVLHTGRRSYIGRLLHVEAESVGLEADSDELEERCRLDLDPGRIEAFETFSA